DEAILMEALGGEHVASEHRFHGDVIRNARRQAQHAARPWDQSALHFGEAEGGVLRSHDEVAGEHDLATASQCIPLDCSDDGLAGRTLANTAEAPIARVGTLARRGESL